MKTLFAAGALAMMASRAFAQAADSTLATRPGHEVNASVSGYTYREPGDLAISIHGAKFGGEYTATLAVNERRHWFAQADVRGTIGAATYDGWCLPWLIRPNSASPNGFELDLGDASPCSESGDKDWYFEGRALFGKDVIGRRWGWSPYTGVGLRHLSNGIGGVSGYRTDDYLYLPLGSTVRREVASRAFSVTVEFDGLIHGWQHTQQSALGGGDVPATATAPAFTIDGLTDLSFAQSTGWALRASGKYQIARRWSVEPYYVYWNIDSSPVNVATATFTVNGVTAHEQFGAFEPFNVTHEFGVKWGFQFR